MAVVITPLPPAYLQCLGEPAMPFETWLKIFENYLFAIDMEGEKWPNNQQRAVLLHSVVTEAQRIFYTLPETGTTYAHAVAALRSHGYNGRVRERLLLEDKLTLNKAIQIANQVESAASDASTFSNS